MIPQWYSASIIKQVSQWTNELLARPLEKDRLMVYFEECEELSARRVVSRVEKFVDYHEGLRAFIYDFRLLCLVGELLDDKPVLFKEKINFKMPGSNGFEPHQDIQAGWNVYATYFLSVLVAIDDSTPENGCLEMAAGRHGSGMIGSSWTPLGAGELRDMTFVPCPMRSGDIAIFDCFVPHRSGPNSTASPRRNLYITYNRMMDGDHREKYFSDKRRSFPPDFEREPDGHYKFRV